MTDSCEPEYYRAFEALLEGDSRPMQAYFDARRQRYHKEERLDQAQLMELELQLLPRNSKTTKNNHDTRNPLPLTRQTGDRKTSNLNVTPPFVYSGN